MARRVAMSALAAAGVLAGGAAQARAPRHRHHAPRASQPLQDTGADRGGGVPPVAPARGAEESAGPDPERIVASYLEHLPPPPAHEAIRGTVWAHEAVLDSCFAGSGAAARPLRDGRVLLRFTVSPAGVASDGSVALDEVGDPALAGCLLGAVLALSYPREPHETFASLPLVVQGGAMVKPPVLPAPEVSHDNG